MKRQPIPAAGIVGEQALREAATTEYGQVRDLLQAALKRNYGLSENDWVYLKAIYPDSVIVERGGKQYRFDYTINDDNTVVLGTAQEVTEEYAPVAPAPAAATAPAPQREAAPALQGEVFIEALDTESEAKPTRYLVRVIRAGTSLNKVNYPASVLREAAPLFNGVRVFVKSDDEHIKGGGKDFRQLVGRLTEAKYVEGGESGGEVQAVLDVLDSSDVAAKLREAVSRGMTDLFGLSIDAAGRSRKSGKFREATKLSKVASVDLIIEPGAGGQFIRFAEALNSQEDDTMLRSQMIKFIEARDAKRAGELAEASDEDVMTAYTEAVQSANASAAAPAPAGVTAEEVGEQIRMVEARANARVTIAESKLPAAIKERLTTRFSEAASFSGEDVTGAIEEERQFLGRLVEGAQVRGLGEGIEMGEGRAEKMGQMLDDFFNPEKRAMSFRECYREITGDRNVTGLVGNCDETRLREAAGASGFREAVSSSTFSNILGDSITRAMIREYGNLPQYQDWRWLCDVVSVSDFRTQERTRLGGYGNLATVAESAAYAAVTSPGDEKATYAATKRGGIETITLETIANDDVGLIRRIPRALAHAAARTLYEFVYDFLADNPTVYDGKTLFHSDHANTATDALAEASFYAARLAFIKQTELSSDKRLGLTLSHLVIPPDLAKTAHDLFVRDTNNDPNFAQVNAPTVHVANYWTDPTDWFATADNAQVPLIELGFYGSEDPEIFVQDQPNQGSLFSNDQIKYKIRHIYGGAVRDVRGFYGAIVSDA
jgi:hypothetical protein